ncbi:MAG: hypothetical protein AAGI46_07285 [Planctomycetota bacterium]
MGKVATAVSLPFAVAAVGGLLGILTNLSHAAISGEYFSLVLNRGGSPQSIAFEHGWIEGGISGFAFGLLLTLFAGASGWAWLSWRNMVRPVVFGLIAAAICMIVGGIAGATWAAVSSDSFISNFRQARRASNVVAFAWVGGSIWAAYGGVLVAMITAAVVWTRQLVRLAVAERGFAVEAVASDE